MDYSKASVTWFHDTRRSKKDEKYPVKITVYMEGEKKRYKTGLDLTKDEFKKLIGSNLRDDQLKIIKRKILALVKKAEDIISGLDSFSFFQFEEQFFEEKRARKSSNISDLFNDYIKRLESNEQIGTAISYKTAFNSINKYKTGLKINDITKEFLIGYEKYMREDKLSSSTCGIYLRQLRRIVNVAIEQGLLSPQKYPFKGYSIPGSRNIKKALNQEQLKALLTFDTDDLNMRKALDFWLFSYISNGINMTDICLLKPDSIGTDFFHFIRSKTKNTKKSDLRPIKVPLTDRTREIIARWKHSGPNNFYLFPVLTEGLTAKQIKYKIQDFIYFINKQMKIVAGKLGIEAKVGTYVARHSHSTMLKRRGVPTELIKENLGHSSILTTERYLDDFDDVVKQEYARLLIDL